MSATEELVAECLAAVKAERAAVAAKEAVERAVRERRLAEELSHETGIRTLYRARDLTVLHVVIPRRPTTAPNPVPHNHLMWACIGILHGRREQRVLPTYGRHH